MKTSKPPELNRPSDAELTWPEKEPTGQPQLDQQHIIELLKTNSRKLRFKYDKTKKEFVRDENGDIPDKRSRSYRQWRDHINTPDDIWNEIAKAGQIPGTTGAPKLQPIADIRQKVITAGTRRVRPCLMTTATTILALIPVLTSTGRGSNIMVPMAIPVFGGMMIEVLTMLVVPVLYSLTKELTHKTTLS